MNQTIELKPGLVVELQEWAPELPCGATDCTQDPADWYLRTSEDEWSGIALCNYHGSIWQGRVLNACDCRDCGEEE